jgi:hypothetical protein
MLGAKHLSMAALSIQQPPKATQGNGKRKRVVRLVQSEREFHSPEQTSHSYQDLRDFDSQIDRAMAFADGLHEDVEVALQAHGRMDSNSMKNGNETMKTMSTHEHRHSVPRISSKKSQDTEQSENRFFNCRDLKRKDVISCF